MLLGGNDLCDVCNDGGDVSADEYAAQMRPAFETLAAVPRLVVNVPLHADYTQLCYMWELAEQGRRFLLVGVYVVGPFHPGSMMQLALAALTCVLYLVAQE